MKRWLFLLACFLILNDVHSQRKEEELDFSFKPIKKGGRYCVVTEKQGDLWHRTAYYLPEKLIAMEGWYADKECEVPHGNVTWYHPTRFVQSKGNYNNGKKEGTWFEYNEDGSLKDSSTYANGYLKGIGIRLASNGKIIDSTNFDGSGNGVRITFNEDGKIFSQAYFEQDTLKTGRWKYFHKDGKPFGIVDYQKGKKIACECYDEEGRKLDTSICN
jgi:antitoxin component YwqK of YwqJK toxin-antitoxin module